MRARWVWIGIPALVAIAFVAFWGYNRQAEVEAQRALDDQLRLAKAEGIPITTEDMSLLYPRVPDAQNAAVEFAEIRKRMLDHGDSSRWRSLVSNWDPVTQTFRDRHAVEVFAERMKPYEELLKRAVKKPKFVPHRKWEDGFAVTFEDLDSIYEAVRSMLVSTDLAVVDRRWDDVISSCTLGNQVAELVEQEESVYAKSVAIRIRTLCAREIIDGLAFAPEHSGLLNTLTLITRSHSPWNRQNLVKTEVLEFLNGLNFLATPEGIKSYPINQRGALERLPKPNAQMLKAKAEIIQCLRSAHTAALAPYEQRKLAVKDATTRASEALLVYPSYFQWVHGGDMSITRAARLDMGDEMTILYSMVDEAIRHRVNGKLPETLDTSQLKNPFVNGKIVYRLDPGMITAVIYRSDTSDGITARSFRVPNEMMPEKRQTKIAPGRPPKPAMPNLE